MIRFLTRRFLTAIGILLALSVMMYAALNLALDPLQNLRDSPALNKQQMIDARIRLLHLYEPWYQRYWTWLTNFVQGDFGQAWATQQSVNSLLPGAIATSFHLVINATLIAIVLGVTIGVISALRQYTTFDYTITFLSFVLYSLPVFWVAVLLKQFMAIDLNDFLSNPSTNWTMIAVVSAIAGLFWLGAIGGHGKRALTIFGIAFAATFATLGYVFGTGWLNDPSIGIIGVAIIGIASALAVTVLFAGMKNRRALYSALTTAAVGIALYYPLQQLLILDFAGSYWFMAILLCVALGIGGLIGWLYGGPDKMVSVRGGALVAFLMSLAVFLDQCMQYWYMYVNSRPIARRPIATSGASTPALGGNFWIGQIDQFTHLLLPTIALVLISFAGYTRYQRGSTLEVLNQDYIRTARSKGLPERVVIVRHALRNALMPLASIIPVDIISLLGGAVITESIFNWNGMGRLFITALGNNEIDPAMVYIMITGAAAMVANLMADFLYALLDPRIRVDA